ncbi:MAG: helix-turn-helix transcriptional regulator [Alphaproteobacteria bacterium]|nr:helix-turn-helix transcriptional regulator [Alphaproteobacteria bacterium]
MSTVNSLAATAALIGDPARAAMLLALLDGRAHSASDLAAIAGIAAPTASGHLVRLGAGGLVEMRAQGRHRFYRLAGRDVAAAIEELMSLSGARAAPASATAAWRRDPDLRFCRTCYDHLAGQVGMAVTDSLTRAGHIEPRGAKDWRLTSSGRLFCEKLGVDLEGAAARPGRHFARRCLDWSERRPHIAGALGAAIADTFFARGWTERLRRGRTVRLTDAGRRALARHFDAVA